MAKPALGRGLGALLGGTRPVGGMAPLPPQIAQTDPSSGTDQTHDRVRRVALDRIRPCPFQPRRDFTEEALRELTDSIREQGIVQPLITRERGGIYELIAGAAEPDAMPRGCH